MAGVVDHKPMIGRKIGRYQIQSVLGKGAMGVVYAAHDPQLDRIVAVKTILLPSGLNPYQRDKRIQSLLNEARLSARLNHPGIVKVYDAGEQNGEPYIVLERVEGQTLTEVLDGCGFMPPECALPMMQEVLEAIACAHDQGLVHRDLKPANIMVHSDGHVRIMDFGIAQLAHELKTPDGKIAGTPRYMAPEQITGKSVDMRSDVFALGVIFYELLSGKKPFPQLEMGELTRAICEAPPTPLQALTTGNIPMGVFSLISRALAKKPEERFPSAHQMLDALTAIRAPEAAAASAAAPPAASSSKEIIDFILQKIARQGDFPTTMQYISAITNTARKETSSATSISQEILKDFALTNRILRMVNSPFYNSTRRSISTISRAVVILGIDSVLDVAAGLSIFEHFHTRCNIPKLKGQTVRALMTAIHAREIAGQVGYANTEEAFICGMMHHLGRLIVTFYFPEEYAAIEQMTIQGLMDENAATRKVMRLTYTELGEAIAQSWRLPDAVMKCCRGLDPKHKGLLRTPEQTLQGIVSMANELSKATMLPEEGRRNAAQAAVVRQFAGILDLNPRQIGKVVENSIRNAWDISHTLRVNLKDLGLADSLIAAAQEANTEGSRAGVSPVQEISPSQMLADPPDDAIDAGEDSEMQRQEFLMKTIGEITSMLMSTYQLNDVLMMVLEGMYRGVGSQHVILALVNPARSHLTYRFGLGPRTDEIKPLFHMPLGLNGSLPAQCILNGQEIFMNNLITESKQGLLPDVLQNLLRAQSIVLLPIVIKDQAIGLFMLDRAPEQKPVTKHELLNLRTLANQAVLAIRQCQSRR